MHAMAEQTAVRTRLGIAGLVLSAAGLVSVVLNEGYRDKAYTDTVGVPTIGFGTTEGVKLGDTTTPPAALVKALRDINKFEGIIKSCVHVPLTQFEFDAYTDFAYNVGGKAFCSSTLVKKLNALDYEGACAEISRWVKQPELTARRARERKMCEGK